MKKGIRLFTLLILTTSSALFSCNKETVNPNRIDYYNHAYDNLKISSDTSSYMSINFDDFDKNYYYNFVSCPRSGTPKLLVVPIWFTDSDTYITNKEMVRSDINTAFNGSTNDTGWESVSTYYYKDSFNKLTVTATVTPWYECGKASSYYYVDTYVSKTKSLVNSATTYAKSIVEDITEYDSNGDGYLDGVVLIYGSPDSSHLEGVNAENMWGYTYWVGSNKASVTSPTANPFFWMSYDFMYSNGIDASNRTGNCAYGSGDTSHCYIDAHGFIHEMGHVFGLEDYYDYSKKAEPALSFSMQDCNIGAHDPFSRLALGWSKAFKPTTTSKIKLKPIESSGEMIMLSNGDYSSPFDEYILIELYTPTGLNKFDVDYAYSGYTKGPDRSGIRLWHIDTRLASFAQSSRHPKITNDPYSGAILFATNNTSPGHERAVSYAGSSKYNSIQVIRRNYKMIDENGQEIEEIYHRLETSLTNSDLFVTGDYFTVHNYRSQFVNGDMLNNKSYLGWNIYFDSVSATEATITVIRE